MSPHDDQLPAAAQAALLLERMSRLCARWADETEDTSLRRTAEAFADSGRAPTTLALLLMEGSNVLRQFADTHPKAARPLLLEAKLFERVAVAVYYGPDLPLPPPPRSARREIEETKDEHSAPPRLTA